MAGKLVILSGPSGVGKSTIAKHLLSKTEFNLAFSVSACSRKQRENEVHGKDYYFLSIDAFKSKVEDNEFIEWEEVYPTCYYGTPKVEVDRLFSKGHNVLFDVDVVGALSIKRIYKQEAISIFIQPPSVQELEQRLTKRGSETDENIGKRLRKANMELTYARKFDHVIVNHDLITAFSEAEKLIKHFLGL